MVRTSLFSFPTDAIFCILMSQDVAKAIIVTFNLAVS